VSFRAVILDVLLDAAAAGAAIPADVIAREALLLMQAKHRHVRGGWSYIPEVPELPPDADDLGQVLQALVRAGGPDLAATCDEPVRLALDAGDSGGAVPTWILNPRVETEADALVREYLPVMGGVGVHPDVVANLLAGLMLYDSERYAGVLERGQDYLERVQQDDGSWASQWYEGPFYGTFKALTVLGRLRPSSPAVAAARGFVLGSCSADGWWSEPLPTAFALLALAAIGGRPRTVVEAAVRRLVHAQRGDGTWAPSPWIVFATIDGVVSHQSCTVTTAFCAKALMAAEAIELVNG
jgi:squalene-hopene/tetraprenyl-beta-curcumene cyclase